MHASCASAKVFISLTIKKGQPGGDLTRSESIRLARHWEEELSFCVLSNCPRPLKASRDGRGAFISALTSSPSVSCRRSVLMLAVRVASFNLRSFGIVEC